MSRLQFNISYRDEIERGACELITRDGQPVTVIDWNFMRVFKGIPYWTVLFKTPLICCPESFPAIYSARQDNGSIFPDTHTEHPKDLFVEIKKSDGYPEDMDNERISLCDALNSLPGVNTFESCCGHLKSQYRIWFFCEDIDTLSRLGRCVERNYSDGRWEILVDSTDTSPRGVFWLRSKEPFESYEDMEQSVQYLIENIKHWFSSEFDEYFKKNPL